MATTGAVFSRPLIRAMFAVVIVCQAQAAFSQAAREPFGGSDGPRAFRLAAADGVISPRVGTSFELGIVDELTGRAPAAEPIRIEKPAAALGPTPAAGGESPLTGPEARDSGIPSEPYGWKQLRFDLEYLAKRPAHLDARDVRMGLAVVGTTGLLYVYRKDIQEAWHDNSSQSRSDFLNSARVMGEAAFAPTVALGAYLASFLTDNDREKETAQLVLESMALSGLAANIGQFVLATERPEDGDAVKFFRSGGHGVSGDVALAASIIPPLRRQYLRVKPADTTGSKILKHGLSALLYSGMVFTALQRIDADKHWAPDVFLGMVTGLGVGGTLGEAHDEAEQQRSRLAVGLVPGGVAVMWTWNLDPR